MESSVFSSDMVISPNLSWGSTNCDAGPSCYTVPASSRLVTVRPVFYGISWGSFQTLHSWRHKQYVPADLQIDFTHKIRRLKTSSKKQMHTKCETWNCEVGAKCQRKCVNIFITDQQSALSVSTDGFDKFPSHCTLCLFSAVASTQILSFAFSFRILYVFNFALSQLRTSHFLCSLGTVENQGQKWLKKHGKLLWKSQKSLQNHGKNTTSNHGPEDHYTVYKTIKLNI